MKIILFASILFPPPEWQLHATGGTFVGPGWHRPHLRPGPDRPGCRARLAAPRRRPERGTKPGGQRGGRPGPRRQPGATGGPERDQDGGKARTARSPRCHPRSRPPGLSASPAHRRHLRCPRSAPEHADRATRRPLPRAADPSPSPQYELPAAFSNSQLRSSAVSVTPCSMRPPHWLGDQRERRGERDRRGNRAPAAAPGMPGAVGRPPTACWEMKSYARRRPVGF